MTTRKPLTWKSTRRLLYISLLLGLGLSFLYLTGQWHLNEDARITEMYVCNTNDTLSHATEFLTTTERLYFCGIVEGTTFGYASFGLWCRGESIKFTRYRIDIGEFYFPITYTSNGRGYAPGKCRITAQYDRKIAHEVNFSIVRP